MPDAASQLADWLRTEWSRDPLSSPKLVSSTAGAEGWYRYYAGYADAFVADVVGRLPEPPGLVLDPWNGSGTTTSVAAAHGIEARGFDLNPAAVVVAKARLLQADVAPSLLPLARKLLSAMDVPGPVSADDLLLGWMTPRSALSVRKLSATIDRSLIAIEGQREARDVANGMSPLAALFYLALFRTVRRAFRRFAGKNPTWMKQRVGDHEKVDVDLRTLRPWLLAEVAKLSETVRCRGLSKPSHPRMVVQVGESGDLPMVEGAAQAVITSPPYCTRIDYAVATLPELAALGISTSQFRSLRDRLIGTPTRDGTFAHSDVRWGTTANGFLSRVADHASYASKSYYLPFFSQYFGGMRRSLAEIGRVVASECPIVLVVQDSWYKDLHADIPAVMCEMAERLGWEPVARHDFHVTTRANINAGTRKYRAPGLATESVLAFSR